MLQKDLREFLELLNSHRVEYVIVGGHAVAYHGYPRFTGDIDFFVRATRENAERIAQVLEDFGFSRAAVSIEDLTTQNRVVQLGRPPNRIDLVTSISGVSFDDAWSSRIEGRLDGLPVQFLGRNALLANKRASGRPKDLAELDPDGQR
jgi:hypothetical protein